MKPNRATWTTPKPIRAAPLLALLLAVCAAAPRPSFAQEPPAVTIQAATSAMEQAMRTRGFTPKDNLSLSDYFTIDFHEASDRSTLEDNSGKGTRHAHMWIGPDGDVIPNHEWQDFQPDYCKRQARYMRAAIHRFDFALHRIEPDLSKDVPDEYGAFARYIDVETGITKEESDNFFTKGLRSPAEALDLAWKKLPASAQAKALADPCDRVRLKHVSGQKVGAPVTFRAGFRGFGKALVYTWDFGDGSAPRDGRSLQVPTHVYDREGTYEVSVQVRELDGETHSRTIEVNIGGGLRLVFSSDMERQSASGAVHGISRYEAEVPLASGDDAATYEGSGPLQNTKYASAAMDKASCTVHPRSATLNARVTLPAQASGASIEAFIAPPDDDAALNPTVECSNAMVAAMIRKGEAAHIWWPGFVVMHDGWGEDGLHVTGWQEASAPGVVARKVYSDTRTMGDGHVTFTEKTTIELRND